MENLNNDMGKTVTVSETDEKENWYKENPDASETHLRKAMLDIENKIAFLWEKTGMHFKQDEFDAFCATRKSAFDNAAKSE